MRVSPTTYDWFEDNINCSKKLIEKKKYRRRKTQLHDQKLKDLHSRIIKRWRQFWCFWSRELNSLY